MKTFGKRIGRVGGLLFLAFAVAVLLPGESFGQKLPVFKLHGPKVEKAKADRVMKKLEKGKPTKEMKVMDRGDAMVHRSGEIEVEIDKESGGIFARDVEKLWNPKIKPDLPNKDSVGKIADDFLKDSDLLPESGPNQKVSFEGFTETALANLSPDGNVEKQVLDVQANYKVEVSVEESGGKRTLFPVVGGGGKLKVAVGHRGEVVGYHGVWRSIEGIAGMEEVLSKDQAIAEFRKDHEGLKLTKADAFLAYHQEGFGKQDIMAPVWVVKGEADIDGVTVPVRNAIIPATKAGPKRADKGPKPKARTEGDQPLQRSLDQDEGSGQSMLDLLVPPAYAHPAYECGAESLGSESGVPGCRYVADRFINRMKGAGWQVNFNWHGKAVWESDWVRNDDLWVDTADLILYCGHADMNGWVVNSPDDNRVYKTDPGTISGNPNDRWGQNDAEWIAIAACGPLQDQHFVSGGGNAFDRWRGAFDGLHILLGYGAVTFDNTQEGDRFAQLLLYGWRVIDAWFRMAWEIQPSTNGWSPPNGPKIYVCAMYAHKGDFATRNDRVWGKGYVAPDPTAPGLWLTLMWQGT